MADKYDAFLDSPVVTGDKYDSYLDSPTQQPEKPQTRQQIEAEYRAKLARINDEAESKRMQRNVEGMSGFANILSGANTLTRGVVSTLFSKEVGDEYFAPPAIDRDSKTYIAGQLVDPASWVLGGVATKAANLIPMATKFAPVIHGAVGAAAAGGVTGALTNPDDPMSGAGTGAVVGGTIGGAIPVVGKALQKSIGWGTDLAKGRAGQVKAGQMARAAAGDKLPDIRTALEGASPDLTAAQAASGVPQDTWQSLGKLAQGADRNSYYTGVAARQEAARKGMLSGVTPDLATAQTNLSVGNTVNYGNAARADAARLAQLETSVNPAVPVIKPSPMGLGVTERVAGVSKPVSTIKGLGDLESLPAFDAAKREAVKLIESLPDMPAEVKSKLVADPTSSVQGLHFIKMAIDNRFKNPNIPSSFENVSDSTLAAIKSKLTSAMKISSPEYDAARTNAMRLYQPVNQSKVLGELSSVLEKPMVGERAAPFVNALGRGEDTALRRAGLDARFGGIDDVLTATQMGAVNKVKNELTRDAAMKASAEAGAGGLRDVITELTTTFRLPPMFRTEVSAMNKVMEVAEKNLSTKTKMALVEGMRNGKTALEMLDTLPTAEKNKILLILSQAGKLSGGAGAVAGVQTSGGK